MDARFEVPNKSVIKESDVYNVLRDLDKFYIPPISSQVDLQNYAKKITENAEIIFVKNKDKIIGISALYCNDLDNLTAFITTIGISEKYQGQGLGYKLMEKSTDLAKSKGMNKIRLEVHKKNKIAINYYRSNNFTIVDTKSDSVKPLNTSSWLVMERFLEC